MIVSGDALLRKVDYGTVSACSRIGLLKVIAGLAHSLPCCRCLNCRIAVINVIAEIHGDRNVLLQKRIIIIRIRCRRSAGLDGHDGCNVVRILRRSPAGTAALGVGYQNRILACHLINLINGCCHGSCHRLIVEIRAHIGSHSRIRRHLTEKLIYRLIIIWELRAFIWYRFSIFPAADTELGIPSLIQSLGADVAADRGSACLASSGLIDQEYAVSHPQEHIRPSFSSVRCGHPAHTGLSVAVKEYHGKPRLVLRNLIKHIGMIHMGSLACAGLLPVILRIKGSFRSHSNAAGRKDSLIGDHQRAVSLCLIGSAVCFFPFCTLCIFRLSTLRFCTLCFRGLCLCAFRRCPLSRGGSAVGTSGSHHYACR